MAYKLTPEQALGIAAADAACRAHGIPTYYDFVKAAAKLVTDIREGRPVKASHERLAKVLDGLRNESADPTPVTVPRTRKGKAKWGAAVAPASDDPFARIAKDVFGF